MKQYGTHSRLIPLEEFSTSLIAHPSPKKTQTKNKQKQQNQHWPGVVEA